MEKEKMSPKDAREMLNTRSGLKGLTGSSDMREIEKLAAAGNDDARLAIYVFAHRLRKYIGAYSAVMGGVDAIVLTGGIGENSAMIRHRALQRLDFLGAVIDEEKNHDAAVSIQKPVFEISTSWSRCKILVVRTDEQLAIAKESRALLEKEHDIHFAKKIPVAVSARHVHLTQAHVEVLFGEGYQLQYEKELSQPGNYACRETVTLVGPKNNLEKVRILGPCRGYSQVEISRTDEFLLGIDAPVRASGHIENTPGMTILGTEGRKLHLDKGVICAWRHIHINEKDASLFGVKDKDVISVEINNQQGRSLIFGDVLIRVDPAFVLEMHIDTDEANAAEIHSGDFGLLVETNAEAQMQSKKA
jgi:acetate kinase